MKKHLFFFLSLFSIQLPAQVRMEPKVFRITSSYTSFPDTGRANGHTYDGVFYNTAEHYSDSSVTIVVPGNLIKKKNIDVVCWFHGWRNNIDSAAAYFELTKQFLAADRNAILIFPETTKNAPDSYGGKLEQKDIFKLLLQDVLRKLKKEKIIGKRTGVGNIVLAGHSGAFRVMAHILQNGGEEVNEIILFDGLYSQIDKFTNWIQTDTIHRFVNLYTNKGGGTDEVSEKMMQLLREKNIAFINPEENSLNNQMLRTNNIIFIHSSKEHNDVINRPDKNFQLILENSPVLSHMDP